MYSAILLLAVFKEELESSIAELLSERLCYSIFPICSLHFLIATFINPPRRLDLVRTSLDSTMNDLYFWTNIAVRVLALFASFSSAGIIASFALLSG